MKKLLIVYYSYTGASRQVAEVAAEAAREETSVETVLMRAEECMPADMLSADGYFFAFPENLAAIAGVMKALFDRCYYPLLGKIEGRPYTLMVCAGSDGSNAVTQAERIATGWRLKKVADSRIVCTRAQTMEEILAPKKVDGSELAKAAETGLALASGISQGIF